MNKKTDIIGIIGLLLTLFTLFFGDNIYQQIKGRSVFSNSTSPIIEVPINNQVTANELPTKVGNHTMAPIEVFAKETATPLPEPVIMFEEFARQTAVSGSLTSPSPSGIRPDTYTLQVGEYPFCIARRFNVNLDDLLKASGMTSPDIYDYGQTLTVPQTGNFPGERATALHPATYTVSFPDENIYSVACKYGDVFPEDIAALNGLPINSSLSVGQQINVP